MGGKSEVLLMLPIARGFTKHEKFKGIIFRRTYPELEREIIVRSQEWYKPTGAKYSDEKKRWVFPSGAIMQFGHLEYEKDARSYDTTEYNYMAFDELTSFTEFQYMYLVMSRNRTPENLKHILPPIARSGTNPGNVGHGWVRKRFIEPAPFGSIIVDAQTKMKRIFIQSKVQDNPYADTNYLAQLSLLPEAERRAKRDGDWWTFSGQVFDDWRDEKFPDEPDNAQHVIPPFEIPKWWPRVLAIDWGFRAMTVALWGAISPDLRLHVYREFSCKQTKISTWATEIGKLSDGEEIKHIVMCQSAWQKRGDEESIIEQFERHSGLTCSPADNERVAGKLLLQEYMRWRPRPKRQDASEGFNCEMAERILRRDGLTAYKGYIASFEEEKEESNLPRLQVFQTCKELRVALPLCVYDDKKVEDVAEFSGDDPYDCVRYLVQVAELYMKENPEAEHQRKVSEVLAAHEQTKDMTSFYRRMERLDVKNKGPRPVRRFHRGTKVA